MRREKESVLEPNPEPAKMPELPDIELGKGEHGKMSKRMEKMQEYAKEGRGPTILPTPHPICKDEVVELAKKCLNAMLETQLQETGQNTDTDWYDISIIKVKEEIDEIMGCAYAYCITFCMTSNYFFEGDHKDYYQITMTDWGGVVKIDKIR